MPNVPPNGFDAARRNDYVVPIMALRPIIILPDPVLREKSTPIARVDDDVRALVADMFDTMYEAPGIGLAAVQVGITKRIVTIDLAREGEDKQPMLFVNPEIVWSSDELSVYEEGCLSIPQYYEEVERPAKIRVRYQDEKGEARELEADGLLATCLQHEIDHLEGKLFIDYLSKLKRDRVVKKFQKQAKREHDL
jgi:peptide deformylase